MFCPLLNAGRPIGNDAVECQKGQCAWGMGRRRGRGSCCIPRMAGYLAGLVSQHPGDAKGGSKVVGEDPSATQDNGS